MPSIPSASEKYQDIITTHSVDVLGFEATLQKQVLGILKRLESDLVAAIAKVDVNGVSAASYKKARLQALLQQTRASIRTAYGEASTATRSQLYQFSKTESDFTAGALNRAVGLDLATVALTPEALRALAQGTLIQGAASNKWWVKQARNTEHRFELAMQTGAAQGEPLGKLVQRVRGTKENGYADGIMAASRREAQALVRTSVQAVANAAGEDTYAANDDVVKGLVWVSTMDARTTPICIAHSGKQYTLEHRPIGHDVPWGAGPGRIHWNCRSKSIPVLKSWGELGAKGAIRTGGRPSDIRAMFEKQLAAQGMSEEQIAAAKMNMRASLDGQIPQDISFEAWLGKKPAAFQNELLGAGKAELFRNGQLPFSNLIDNSNRTRTLEQLQAMAAQMTEEMGAVIRGNTSGMSKVDFFKKTLGENNALKLTDPQLQALWDAEFPPETHGTRYLVQDIRSKFNRGGFGEVPKEPTHQWGEGGKLLKAGKVPVVKPPPLPPPPVVEPPYVPPTPKAALPLTSNEHMMVSDLALDNWNTKQNVQELLETVPEREWYSSMSPRMKLEYWAKENKMTPEQFAHEMEVRLQKMVNGMDVSIRAYDGTLEKILKDGRFKSQFESGASGGMFDLPVRTDIEAELFGLTEKTQPHLRPIYGYMSPSESGFGELTNDVKGYGNVSFKLKNSARSHVMISFDDSLTNYQAEWSDTLPSSLQNVRAHSVSLIQSQVNPLDFLADKKEIYKHFNFIEAQVMGGVDLAEIESIRFEEKALYDKFRATLAEKRITAELYDETTGKLVSRYGVAEAEAEKVAAAAKRAAEEAAKRSAASLEGTRYGELRAAVKREEEYIDSYMAKVKQLQTSSQELRGKVWGSGPGSFKWNSPESLEGRAALEKVDNEIADWRRAKNQMEKEMERKMESVLMRKQGEGLPIKTVFKAHPESGTSPYVNWKLGVEKGVEDFSRLVDPAVVKNAEVAINYMPKVKDIKTKQLKVARAFFRNSENAAYLGEGDSTLASTTVHELGHFIEHNNARASRAAQDFLVERTTLPNGSREKLTRIYPHNSKNKEMGWKDKFMDHYAGRDYGNWGVTEIISMGLQWLRDNPAQFYRQDNEYFELMMKIVGNMPW